MTLSARHADSLPVAEPIGETEHLRVFVTRAQNSIVVIAIGKDSSPPPDLLSCVVQPAAMEVKPGWLGHVVPADHEHAPELIECLDAVLGPLVKDLT